MPRFVYQNQEIRHYDQVMRGTAVVLTNKNGVKLEKKKIVPQEGGIYSDVMGQLVDDDININEYSCSPNCRNLIGRIYEGQVCPVCGQVVKNNFGADITRNGWINLDKYKVVVPAAWKKLTRLIGTTTLDDIISFDDNIDFQGNVVIGNNVRDPKKPFSKIGMMEFYKRFEEIINYYGKIKKKPEEAKFLITFKNRIFTSKIPVISQHLRPAFINSSEMMFKYDGINACYSIIISNASMISKAQITNRYMNINKSLYTIQKELEKLYSMILQKLDGKKKLMRRKIQGTKMSWSSRMVITANTGTTYGIDHIVISYKAFFELYFFEIINCLKRGIVTQFFVDKTIYEIIEWLDVKKYSTKVDPVIYKVMKWLIDNNEDGLWCLVNRPPTMELGSLQMLRVVDVIPDAKESNMKVPLTSLVAWNADFDGDTLSVYSIKERCVAEEFSAGFNPRNLILNKTSSHEIYNSQFGLPKDLCIFLYSFVPPANIKEPVAK